MEESRPASRGDLERVEELAREMRGELGPMRGGDLWRERDAWPEPLAVTYAALVLNRASAAIGFIDAVQIVGASFVAGFLAPVARDIVAAVQSRK